MDATHLDDDKLTTIFVNMGVRHILGHGIIACISVCPGVLSYISQTA